MHDTYFLITIVQSVVLKSGRKKREKRERSKCLPRGRQRERKENHGHWR